MCWPRLWIIYDNNEGPLANQSHLSRRVGHLTTIFRTCEGDSKLTRWQRIIASHTMTCDAASVGCLAEAVLRCLRYMR